jgi:hypothetical protein
VKVRESSSTATWVARASVLTLAVVREGIGGLWVLGGRLARWKFWGFALWRVRLRGVMGEGSHSGECGYGV